MSLIVERIIEKAKGMGACKLAEGIHTMQDLVTLFFTPQGREFCIGHDFPNMPDFRLLKSEHLSYFNVFCDMGRVQVENAANVGAVGKTRLQAKFADDAGELHQVMLMHGAEAEIEIGRHAVIHIEKTPDCKVKIINLDNTGIVL